MHPSKYARADLIRRANICFNCSKKELVNINSPKCHRKSNNNHKLTLKEFSGSLKFCDDCKTKINQAHFACPKTVDHLKLHFKKSKKKLIKFFFHKMNENNF